MQGKSQPFYFVPEGDEFCHQCRLSTTRSEYENTCSEGSTINRAKTFLKEQLAPDVTCWHMSQLHHSRPAQ